MGINTSTGPNNSYRQQVYQPFDQIVGKGRTPKMKHDEKRSFSPKKRSNTISSYQLSMKKSNSWFQNQPVWFKMDDESSEYPACAVGFIQSYFGNGLVLKGTGFLIHKKLVMTCAHYLYSHQLRQSAQKVVFYPARNKVQGVKLQASRVFYPEEYERSKDKKDSIFWDFGLVMLNQDLEESCGYLGISFDDSEIRKIEPKVIYGYFSGTDEVQMCRFEGACTLEQGLIRHDFPTIKDIEGGPMLIQAGKDSVVIGMHQGSELTNQSRALKFTTRIYDRLNSWLRQKHGFLRIGKITNNQELRRINMFSWKNLSYVDLSGNNIGPAVVQLMLECQWSSILGLNMSNNSLGCLGAKQLAKGNWPNLEELNLDSNMLGNQAVEHLKNAKWPHIRKITLSKNTFEAGGLKALVSCDWKKLNHSDLSHNNIGVAGAKELSVSHRKRLQQVNLGDTSVYAEKCNLEGEGVYWLTKADWKKIRRINLGGNRMQDDGVKQLIDTNWFHLQELILDQNNITREGFKLLLLIQWKYLKKLSVKHNEIDGKGFILMGNCEWQNLQELNAQGNKVLPNELAIITETLQSCLLFLKTINF